LTVAGGIGISKKSYFGDSLGIDNLNANKSNKFILYQSSNDLTQTQEFTGLGNTGGGHLTYQVPSTSNDHIFYAATSSSARNEVFRIKGTNELSIRGSSQSYSILGGGDTNNSLSFNINSRWERYHNFASRRETSQCFATSKDIFISLISSLRYILQTRRV
jgi:hypothetical protein